MSLPLSSWIVGSAAGLLVGLSKTGMPGLGMVIVPLLAAIFPAKQAVGAMLPLLLVGDLFAIARYRQHARWDRLARLLPFVFLGMLPARLVLARLPENPFKLALGVLVLLLVILELARRRWRWENAPHSVFFVAGMGMLAGFATTIGNVAGPIMSIYLLSMGMDKHAFMGTGAWYYLIVNAVKAPLFAQLGMITAGTLEFDLMVAPLVVGGALLGIVLLPRIPQKFFTGVVFVLAVLASALLILSVLWPKPASGAAQGGGSSRAMTCARSSTA